MSELSSTTAAAVADPAKDRLNPYAKYLGGAEPLIIMEGTAAALAKLVRDVPEATLTRAPAPGKWSVRDIMCHLADTELAFGFRLRQTVSQDDHVIQPFDQELWAKPSNKLTTREGLDAFTAFRKWNLLFVNAVGPGVLDKRVTHPERGEMTFRHILETMGGHDINHLRQIERHLTPA